MKQQGQLGKKKFNTTEIQQHVIMTPVAKKTTDYEFTPHFKQIRLDYDVTAVLHRALKLI